MSSLSPTGDLVAEGRTGSLVYENKAPAAEHAAQDSSAANPHWKRDIGLILGGQAASIFGSALVQFAIIWHITLTTQSASLVTLATIAGFAPQGIISLFGGTLADRVNRRLLIVVPDAIIALATLGLAIVMSTGYSSMALILCVMAIRSAGAGFQTPAVQALIPAVTPPEQLMRVNSLHSTAQSIIGLAAPAAAGVVYGLGGVVPTLYIDVVTAIIAIGIMMTIRFDTTPPMRDKEPFYREILGGITYTAKHRILRWVMTVFGVIFIMNVAPMFLVPLMMTQRFGENVWNLSVLEMSFHVGMIVGGIIAATFLNGTHRMRMVLWTSIGFGVLEILMPLSPTTWGLFVLMLITGLLVPAFSSPTLTEVQQNTEPEYMGRVMSQVSILFSLGVPAGMALLGPFAHLFGVAQVVLACGILTLAFVAWAFFGTPTGRAMLVKKN